MCLQIIYLDKGLMSKMCEGLIQAKSKKPNIWILKWTEELCRHFSKKRTCKWPSVQEKVLNVANHQGSMSCELSAHIC